MKSLMLAAFAALSLGLGAAIAQPVTHDPTPPTAQRDATPQTTQRDARPQTPRHTGPYDNTANSLGGRYVGGGD